MKKLTLIVATIALALSSINSAFATRASLWSPAEVKEIIFYSSDSQFSSRLGDWAGVVQVKFNGVSFRGIPANACSTTDLVVNSDDKALISALLAAHATKTPINVEVFDDIKLGTFCYILAITYK